MCFLQVFQFTKLFHISSFHLRLTANSSQLAENLQTACEMGIIIHIRQGENLRKELDKGHTKKILLERICAARLFAAGSV